MICGVRACVRGGNAVIVFSNSGNSPWQFSASHSDADPTAVSTVNERANSLGREIEISSSWKLAPTYKSPVRYSWRQEDPCTVPLS